MHKFETFGVSGRTALLAINGKFVSSLSDGPMRADADEIGAEDLFVPQVSGSIVSLRTKDGGFLGGEIGVTMDEDVRSQIATVSIKTEAPMTRAKPFSTFESDVEPEIPPPAPARLLNLPSVASSGALPAKKMLSAPKPRPS